ncbi:MAG: hypothetical protein Q6K70_05020 [Thermostichales cyanobacterium DRC_bins_46]
MPRNLTSVLEQHIAGLPGVLAVVIGRSTDDATIAEINYSGAELPNNPEFRSLTAYAGDLLRANTRFCHLFDNHAVTDNLLAGSPEVRLVIKAFSNSPYFAMMVVQASTDIKLVIERLRAILKDARPLLPAVTEGAASTARLLLNYARRYAPDPNFVMLRLSLKTGIHRERLEKGALNKNEVQVLYRGIADLLGVERLPILVN